MTHFANPVLLYVGKYTRNSYVSGALTDEHNIPVQSSSSFGIMVSTICSFFVSALQLFEIRLQNYIFNFEIAKKNSKKIVMQGLHGY